MNPDRATLNFLNSFPEEARKRGERLQKDGAVTQIFGNHLFIQGRVEDETGVFRTSLRLQGNRWFGSCTAEDEIISAACQYATMMERMHRGEDLPESPNEFDDTPVLDIIEEKLGRELDDKEADFVSKIEKRYRRYVIEGELHDHDMVRITPRWEITTYEPLELWPMPPGDILEFWNYLAYAFYKKKLPYPEFMNVITDLAHVQKKMADWEQEREVASWYDRIEQVNERPPQEPPIEVAFRLVATINEARIEAKEGNGLWTQIREKNEIERFVQMHHQAALRMDAPSQVLWEHFLSYYRDQNETTFDFDVEEACRFMNRVFRQPALKGYLVNLDEREFKVVTEALKWVCEDDPYDPGSFALQLVTAGGENVSHSVRMLPGRKELYQSDETVFPGPPRWLEETEVMPRYLIPKRVIDSLEGVEFLRKIGASLPESLKKRVVDLELKPKFELKLVAGLTAAETEHLVIDVTAIESKERRTERLTKEGWELVEQAPLKGKQLLRFAREELYPVPRILEEMGLTYDEKLLSFKSRITKQFPEKFAEWIKAMPESVTLDIDLRLKSILSDPVTAAVRFEVINQEIDWFDLRIVIDVEGVNLSKAQIRQLVAARGGYVRMEDGSWMRLEIKLDADQREAVTRLGLDPFDLSGETHRMHALQLADPKARRRLRPEGLEAHQGPRRRHPDRGAARRSRQAQRHAAPLSGRGLPLPRLPRDQPLRRHPRRRHGSRQNHPGADLRALADGRGREEQGGASPGARRLPEVRARRLGRRGRQIRPRPPRPGAPQPRGPRRQGHPGRTSTCWCSTTPSSASAATELNEIKWLAVILDEGQQIKNPDSKAAKAARELDSAQPPRPHRHADREPPARYVEPHGLRHARRARQPHVFQEPLRPPQGHRLRRTAWPPGCVRSCSAAPRGRSPSTCRRGRRRTSTARWRTSRRSSTTPNSSASRSALLGLDSDEALQKNRFAILQGLMRLRQICCHPGLIDPKYLEERERQDGRAVRPARPAPRGRPQGARLLAVRLHARPHQGAPRTRRRGPSTTSPARPRTAGRDRATSRRPRTRPSSCSPSRPAAAA